MALTRYLPYGALALVTMFLAYCGYHVWLERNVPAQSERYQNHGFSLIYPDGGQIREYGSESPQAAVTADSGVLMIGLDRSHTMTLVWLKNPILDQGMSSAEENLLLRSRLKLEVRRILDGEPDPKAEGSLSWNPPLLRHRVQAITWSYKNEAARVFGATAVLYCRQTNRIFQFTLLGNDPEIRNYLVRNYVFGLECHGP